MHPNNWETPVHSSVTTTFSSQYFGFPQYFWQVYATAEMLKCMLYMYVCTHTCMYVIFMHIYMHTDIHTYIHAYTHAYIHGCIHTYMHACMYICTNVYTHTYMHCSAHAYIGYICIYRGFSGTFCPGWFLPAPPSVRIHLLQQKVQPSLSISGFICSLCKSVTSYALDPPSQAVTPSRAPPLKRDVLYGRSHVIFFLPPSEWRCEKARDIIDQDSATFLKLWEI